MLVPHTRVKGFTTRQSYTTEITDAAVTRLGCLLQGITRQQSGAAERVVGLTCFPDRPRVPAGFLDARALAVDYRSIGFRECLTEVVRYLGVLEGQSTADPIRLRLLSHLNNYVAEMEPSPAAASLLPVPTWPWSFLHSPVPLPRRDAAPAPLLVTASYPRLAARPAPVRRVPADVLPSHRGSVPGRIASSARRARGAPSASTAAAAARMPSPSGAPRGGSAKGSPISALLFSPAGVPLPAAYAAPAVLGAAAQGPALRVGAARLCRSWATEIGAF